MMFSYNLGEDSGRVRLLIPDSRATGYVFEDEEILAFLSLEIGVKRAAALALETIASDQALTLKAITLLDLTTDGAKVSDALLKRAGSLREQATLEEEGQGEGFAIAGVIVDSHTLEQAYWQRAIWGKS
jgi:hypothetical protein